MALKTIGDMVQGPDIFARGKAAPAKSAAATVAVTPKGELPKLTRAEAGARFRARWRVQRIKKGDPDMLPPKIRNTIPKAVQRFMPGRLTGEERLAPRAAPSLRGELIESDPDAAPAVPTLRGVPVECNPDALPAVPSLRGVPIVADAAAAEPAKKKGAKRAAKKKSAKRSRSSEK